MKGLIVVLVTAVIALSLTPALSFGAQSGLNRAEIRVSCVVEPNLNLASSETLMKEAKGYQRYAEIMHTKDLPNGKKVFTLYSR